MGDDPRLLDSVSKIEKDAEGDEKTDCYFVMRSYTVFNIDQVEGDHLHHRWAGTLTPAATTH